MKFSKRIYYGVVFLMHLHYTWPKYIGVKEFAESDNLPHKFLEGIASDLRKGDFLAVKRGAGGGYRLACPLREISFLQVVRCLDYDREKQISIESDKSTKQESVLSFLGQTSQSIDRVLDDITLDALPELHSLNDSMMYYI
jgi:Rrf2 family cysteine metabolism transcriptional repressor